MATNMIRQVQVGATNYDINSVRTGGILYGRVDGTSTATAFTATVEGLDGVTEYYDGLTIFLKNGVVTSASGFTVNINGLGAKPVYSNMAAATADTTIFNVNYTMMFIYDTQRVSGGCWICYRGYNSDTNTIAYQVRHQTSNKPVSSQLGRYRLIFNSADGTKYVPANSSNSTSATAAKTVPLTPIDPFGEILYYGYTTVIAANSKPGATYLFSQHNAVTLGYSFNRTGAALTLTTSLPVYICCTPQADGSAIIDANNPFVQGLPSSDDGKIYIFLGIATAATTIELLPEHPVYYYKNNGIRLWSAQPSYTAADPAAVKIGRDVFGNVVIGGELNLGDVGGVSPMKFKGTIGQSGGAGVVAAVPTSDVSEGDTWKIIEENKIIGASASTTGSQFTAKVGDLIISTLGGSSPKWTLVPSGDEPTGTVTSVAVANATNGGLTISGSPVTSSGTINVGHSNVLGSAQTTQAVYPIAIDKNGHISSYGSAVTIPTDPVLTVANADGTDSFELDHGSTMYYYASNALSTSTTLTGGSFPTIDTNKFSGGSAASWTSSLGSNSATAANPTTLTITFNGGSPASISSGFYSGGSFPTLNQETVEVIAGLVNDLPQPM